MTNHRLYRWTNHDNIHVRGYKEEGTITTPYDMTVLNDLDRFHLVMDTIARQPQTGGAGAALKRQLGDKLVDRRRCIREQGQDLPAGPPLALENRNVKEVWHGRT